MEKCSKFIVKYRNIILLVATLLLIPSVIGYMNTRVNYDILTYLPKDSPLDCGAGCAERRFQPGGYGDGRL